MNRQMTAPAVLVGVQFGPALSRLADLEQAPVREMRLGIEAALQGLLDDLGIQGQAQVDFTMSAGDPFRVTVCGAPAPYSTGMARELWEYVTSWPEGDAWREFSFERWSLRNLPLHAGPAEADKWPRASGFLSRLAVEIVKQRPERLFQPEQAAAYLSAAGHPPKEDSPIDPSDLLEIARELLRLNLSIRDRTLILDHVREGVRIGLDHVAIVEELVNRLRPRVITIDMHPAGLRRLLNVNFKDREIRSAAGAESEAFLKLFAMLSDGLFYELGIRVPRVEFRADETLNEVGFVVYLNNVPGLPRNGLAEGQLLVDETPEGLKPTKIACLPARNPANGRLCALIGEKDAKQAKDIGLTTWAPLEYMVLSLSAEIRRRAALSLDCEAVEAELAEFSEVFPKVALAAMDAVSPAILTRVLRYLLWEEIGIRDFRTILGRVATYDTVVADTSRRIVFDDRLAIDERLPLGSLPEPELYVEFVRQGMKNYLSNKYTRGTNNLMVFLLSPELETIMLDDLAGRQGDPAAQRMSVEQAEKIRSAIASELEWTRSSNPVILTFAGIRGAVRRLIGDQYPQLAVLAYEELAPDLKIQPLARISLA